MSRITLCVTYPDACPDSNELIQLRSPDIRLFTYSLSEMERALSFMGGSTKVGITVNNQWAECGWDFSNWINFIKIIANKYSGVISWVALINEADIWHWQPPIGNPDPTLTPEWSADRVAEAAPILYNAGIQPIITSVASGNWPEYLNRMCSRLHYLIPNIPLWADLHLYAKTAGGIPNQNWQSVQAALAEAKRISGYPVCSTEGGIKVHDAGGLSQHAKWVTNYLNIAQTLSEEDYPFLSLFCWSDSGGSPGEQWDHGFGLRDPNGNPRPARQTFINLSSPRFVLGFKEWADADPNLLGQPLENERGGIEGFSIQETDRVQLMAQYLAYPTRSSLYIGGTEYKPTQGWVITCVEKETRNRYQFINGRTVRI